MNKHILIIALLLFSFKIKEKNAPNLLRLMKSEHKITLENGGIILIYNGVCKGGLCGSKLNNYLLKHIPTNPTDSIYFLALHYDKNLIDTLSKFSKSRVLYTSTNTLNKYGIYEQESTAIRIKKSKITHSTKIHQGTRFKHWSF